MKKKLVIIVARIVANIPVPIPPYQELIATAAKKKGNIAVPNRGFSSCVSSVAIVMVKIATP